MSIAEWWTKTSAVPSSGAMKPKPLSALNHFTVPCAICLSPKTSPDPCPSHESAAGCPPLGEEFHCQTARRPLSKCGRLHGRKRRQQLSAKRHLVGRVFLRA